MRAHCKASNIPIRRPPTDLEASYGITSNSQVLQECFLSTAAARLLVGWQTEWQRTMVMRCMIFCASTAAPGCSARSFPASSRAASTVVSNFFLSVLRATVKHRPWLALCSDQCADFNMQDVLEREAANKGGSNVCLTLTPLVAAKLVKGAPHVLHACPAHVFLVDAMVFQCPIPLHMDNTWARPISSALKARARVLRELFQCASWVSRRVNKMSSVQLTSCARPPTASAQLCFA